MCCRWYGMDKSNNPQKSGEPSAAAAEVIYPQRFAAADRSKAAEIYLREPIVAKLAEFFEAKGLAKLKEEDQREEWYADWIEYQARHRIYATVLAPKQFAKLGGAFDLLRLVRLLEVFAYYSPSHGYSLQVTFLGLFSILMGENEDLKREAVAALEAGGLMGFGISEKGHGADLFGNEFAIRPVGEGKFLANGRKYYIGNANIAAMISILARKEDEQGRVKRVPFVSFAIRPATAKAYRCVGKIRTLGVRAAFVGELEVVNHQLPVSDIVADGRGAWDASFGTVTLGKFFLGFASIGICERATEEALGHLRSRILYGKPVIEMPHIRALASQAYVRLTAMKLYAYRALDYVRAANEHERRYLLYNAVQKAKVSTEGVKVIALLSECVGARGLESDTFFEMALRDAQLVPGLEGSTHINLGMTTQFAAKYFARDASELKQPPSLVAGEAAGGENPYLMEAKTGATNTISFGHFLNAYRPLVAVGNVRIFARQAKVFAMFLKRREKPAGGDEAAIPIGQCVATIAYGQLVAENALRLGVAAELVGAIFQMLVGDLSGFAMALAAHPSLGARERRLMGRMVVIPKASGGDWEWVGGRVGG